MGPRDARWLRATARWVRADNTFRGWPRQMFMHNLHQLALAARRALIWFPFGVALLLRERLLRVVWILIHTY